MGHSLFLTRLGSLDVMAFIEGKNTYEDLIKHTVEIEFRGNPLLVLDIQKIIELKRTSKDPKDQHRLAILEETSQQIKKQ